MVKISLRYGIIKKILILHLIMKIFKIPIPKLSPLKGSTCHSKAYITYIFHQRLYEVTSFMSISS